MALHQWLMPGENIHYRGGGVRLGGAQYDFIVTSERLLFHSIRGAFFPKESVVTERLADIESMKYEEVGLIKEGVLRIHFVTRKTITISGRPENIRAAWQTLQNYIRRPSDRSDDDRTTRIAFEPPPSPPSYDKPVISSGQGCTAASLGAVCLGVAGILVLLFIIGSLRNSYNYNPTSYDTSANVNCSASQATSNPAPYSAPTPLPYVPSERRKAPFMVIYNLARCGTQELNVRAAPSPRSDIVGKLYYGQEVTIVDTRGAWTEITWMDGYTAFVLTKYLMPY